MNYAQIREYDVANGTGIRTVLFVSGCTHHCKGCFNKAYQSFRYGDQWTQEVKERVLNYVGNPNIQGLSLLGGEPFEYSNVPELTTLSFEVKKEYPNKDIWAWSGYRYEQIVKDPYRLPLLLYCDVLVDGEFVEELKDITLKFRGSSNQRIIDVKKSLAKGEVVLWEFKNF